MVETADSRMADDLGVAVLRRSSELTHLCS